MTSVYKSLHSTNGNAETEPFIAKVNYDKETVWLDVITLV